MDDARAVRLALQAVSRELENWATVAGRLEDLIGGLMPPRPMNDVEIRIMQDMDQLGQHLRQLSRFSGDVAAEGADEAAVSQAIERLNLAGLKARLTDAETITVKSGEPEIW